MLFRSESAVKKLVTFLYKIALKKAKVVFFENIGNKQTFLDLHILKEKQICVLNGAGVNLAEYPFCEYPSENETRFLFIGHGNLTVRRQLPDVYPVKILLQPDPHYTKDMGVRTF